MRCVSWPVLHCALQADYMAAVHAQLRKMIDYLDYHLQHSLSTGSRCEAEQGTALRSRHAVASRGSSLGSVLCHLFPMLLRSCESTSHFPIARPQTRLDPAWTPSLRRLSYMPTPSWTTNKPVLSPKSSVLNRDSSLFLTSPRPSTVQDPSRTCCPLRHNYHTELRTFP